jgi:hypothetical protein
MNGLQLDLEETCDERIVVDDQEALASTTRVGNRSGARLRLRWSLCLLRRLVVRHVLSRRPGLHHLLDIGTLPPEVEPPG